MRSTIEMMDNTNKQYEVERRFLIKEIPFEVTKMNVPLAISQFYINESGDENNPLTFRIRVTTIQGTTRYVKTIKTPSGGEFAQNEYEVDLTEEEFLEIQKKASTKITKIRYVYSIDGNTWEFDKFSDFDMYMCELEKIAHSADEIEKVEKEINNIVIPDIVKNVLIKEVTGQIEYSNRYLSVDYEDIEEEN